MKSAKSTKSENLLGEVELKKKIMMPMVDERNLEPKHYDADEWLIGPLRHRLTLNPYDIHVYNPVCGVEGYCMIQQRDPDLPGDGDFTKTHPVWHCYTRLYASQLTHLPHRRASRRLWHPACIEYAMIFDPTKGLLPDVGMGIPDYSKWHPTFTGYRTDHWIELLPDPEDQRNPAAKLTMTHCKNAPNILPNSRFKYSPETWNPMFLGYCAHALEESPNPKDHEIHPATWEYILVRNIQRSLVY